MTTLILTAAAVLAWFLLRDRTAPTKRNLARRYREQRLQFSSGLCVMRRRQLGRKTRNVRKTNPGIGWAQAREMARQPGLMG